MTIEKRGNILVCNNVREIQNLGLDVRRVIYRQENKKDSSKDWEMPIKRCIIKVRIGGEEKSQLGGFIPDIPGIPDVLDNIVHDQRSINFSYKDAPSGPKLSLGDGAIVVDSIIGRNVEMGRYVRVYHSQIGADTRISYKGMLNFVFTREEVEIGELATIGDPKKRGGRNPAIVSLDQGSQVEKNATVPRGCVLGRYSRVLAGVVLPAFFHVVEGMEINSDLKQFLRTDLKRVDADSGLVTGR